MLLKKRKKKSLLNHEVPRPFSLQKLESSPPPKILKEEKKKKVPCATGMGSGRNPSMSFLHTHFKDFKRPKYLFLEIAKLNAHKRSKAQQHCHFEPNATILSTFSPFAVSHPLFQRSASLANSLKQQS